MSAKSIRSQSNKVKIHNVVLNNAASLYDSKYVTDLFTREIFTTGHNLVNKVGEYDVRFGQLAAIAAYIAHLKI